MTPNIFPVLRYSDARAGIDWLARAYGFENHSEHAGPDGRIVHAELRFGAGLIAVSSAGPGDDANQWSAVRQGVYVAIDDPDAHHAQARAAGVEILKPPHDTDYGSREYWARDVGGHLWSFGTYAMGAGEGDPTIYPELRYESAAAIEWLAKAFGFRPTAQIPGADGAIFHAEMCLGDGTIMLSLGSTSSAWGGLNQTTSVRVDDPDAHHAGATAAGAEIVMALTSTHYGARMYCARDPEGFLWVFSTYRPRT